MDTIIRPPNTTYFYQLLYGFDSPTIPFSTNNIAEDIGSHFVPFISKNDELFFKTYFNATNITISQIRLAVYDGNDSKIKFDRGYNILMYYIITVDGERYERLARMGVYFCKIGQTNTKIDIGNRNKLYEREHSVLRSAQ
jgi:hypothetical protein